MALQNKKGNISWTSGDEKKMPGSKKKDDTTHREGNRKSGNDPRNPIPTLTHDRQVGPEHQLTHNGGGEPWAIKLESCILTIISNSFILTRKNTTSTFEGYL